MEKDFLGKKKWNDKGKTTEAPESMGSRWRSRTVEKEEDKLPHEWKAARSEQEIHINSCARRASD